jgi:hypothetical protein
VIMLSERCNRDQGEKKDCLHVSLDALSRVLFTERELEELF